VSCFLLGLSTRKLASALLPVRETVSAATVSRLARSLDELSIFI